MWRPGSFSQCCGRAPNPSQNAPICLPHLRILPASTLTSPSNRFASITADTIIIISLLLQPPPTSSSSSPSPSKPSSSSSPTLNIIPPSPTRSRRTFSSSLCTSKGLWCDRSLGTQCLGTAVSHTYRPTVPYHQDTVVVPRLFGWWCMTTGGYVAPTWPILQPRNPTLPHASPHYSEHPTRGGHAPTCGTRALIHPASSSIPTSFYRSQSKLPPILRQDPHTISDIHHHHVVS